MDWADAWCMKRRSLIAFIWFWGLWSTGSTLDYLGVVPMWPFLLLGVAVTAFVLLPRRGLAPQVTAAAKSVEVR
jgi:hypothetical protein